MILKKIDAMHRRYGKIEDKRCSDCCNFCEKVYGKKYFKCSLYGMSSSTATDWAKKWVACGQFNIPFEPDGNRAWFYNEPEKTVLKGQLTIEDLYDIISSQEGEII